MKPILAALIVANACSCTHVEIERNERVDVVIVGAGLSGLIAAHQLKAEGLTYRIIEAAPRAGGRVRTTTYTDSDGNTVQVDSGMEEYWASNPIVGLIHDLGLPVQADTAMSSIIIDGSLEVPQHGETQGGFLRRILGPEEKTKLDRFFSRWGPLIRTLNSQKSPQFEPALQAESFGDWVAKQGLGHRASEWLRISVECEIGTSWKSISAAEGLVELHIFLGEGEDSFRLVGGNERLVDALVKSVGRSNILFDSRVSAVRRIENQSVITAIDARTGKESKHRAGAVIVTAPLFRLSEIQFLPALSSAKRAAIAAQSWGAYFKAHVFLGPGAIRRFRVGERQVLPVLSDSKLGVIYDGSPLAEDRHIISLLICGSEAERFNFASLDEVRAEITQSFEAMWPGLGAAIERIEFFRFHPRAIAAWPPGRTRFDVQSTEIRTPENGVFLAGDFTEGTHSNGAFLSAQRAVRQVVHQLRKDK